MLFKNAFHLLVDNFSLNFKLLLYKVIVAVITLALSFALLYPTLNMLFTSQPFSDVLDAFAHFFKALASGDTAYLSGFAEELQGKVSVLLDFIREKTPNVVFFCVFFVVIVLISKFLSGMGSFVCGKLLDNKMASYAKTSFSGAFISLFGKAALWQIVYVPLTFAYDLCVLALCYLFFLILLNVISFAVLASFAALMLSVALFLVAQALKLTLFNDAVPSMISDKTNLRSAFCNSFRFTRERFSLLFSTYLITALIIMCLNVLCALATFGAALLITLPMSYVMLSCIQFVSYYTFGRKKYFLTQDTIIQPKEGKNRENFYDDFEI